MNHLAVIQSLLNEVDFHLKQARQAVACEKLLICRYEIRGMCLVAPLYGSAYDPKNPKAPLYSILGTYDPKNPKFQHLEGQDVVVTIKEEEDGATVVDVRKIL